MSAPRPRSVRGVRGRPVADFGWWLLDLALVPCTWLAEVAHLQGRRGRLALAIAGWLVGVLTLTLLAFPISQATGSEVQVSPWLIAGALVSGFTLALWHKRDELL